MEIAVEDPVVAPPLLATDKVNLLAKPRMKWMRDPNRSGQFPCVSCSSLRGPKSAALGLPTTGCVHDRVRQDLRDARGHRAARQR